MLGTSQSKEKRKRAKERDGWKIDSGSIVFSPHERVNRVNWMSKRLSENGKLPREAKICFRCDCKRFINVAALDLPSLDSTERSVTKSFCLQIELLKGSTRFSSLASCDPNWWFNLLLSSLCIDFPSHSSQECCGGKVFMINIRLDFVLSPPTRTIHLKASLGRGRSHSSSYECKWHCFGPKNKLLWELNVNSILVGVVLHRACSESYTHDSFKHYLSKLRLVLNENAFEWFQLG